MFLQPRTAKETDMKGFCFFLVWFVFCCLYLTETLAVWLIRSHWKRVYTPTLILPLHLMFMKLQMQQSAVVLLAAADWLLPIISLARSLLRDLRILAHLCIVFHLPTRAWMFAPCKRYNNQTEAFPCPPSPTSPPRPRVPKFQNNHGTIQSKIKNRRAEWRMSDEH